MNEIISDYSVSVEIPIAWGDMDAFQHEVRERIIALETGRRTNWVCSCPNRYDGVCDHPRYDYQRRIQGEGTGEVDDAMSLRTSCGQAPEAGALNRRCR